MWRVTDFAALLWVALCLSVSPQAPGAAASSAAVRGRQLYIAMGCYECHGYGGEGTVGPKLGPNPLPLDVFTRQLRDPINFMPIRMPVYTAEVLSTADIAAIHAFLDALPNPRPVAQIPLLK